MAPPLRAVPCFAASGGCAGVVASLTLTVALGLSLPPAACGQDVAAQGLYAEVQERLRLRLEPLGSVALTADEEAAEEAARRLQVAGRKLHAVQALVPFYEQRVYRPAWLGDGGRRLDQLLTVLERSADHGLDPDLYHYSLLARWTPLPGNDVGAGRAVDLDLLATDAFLILGGHLVSGRVDPETFDSQWQALLREVDLVQLLNDAVGSGEVAAALEHLLPVHPAYPRLVAALARYRALEAAGGWPEIAVQGPTLRLDDRGEEVALLAARLRATGDLPPGHGAVVEAVFDPTLDAAVRRFQERHGLEPDGVVGARTREALAVPAAARVRQIELNLERWRWLPRDLGERYVLVDVPAFHLELVEEGTQVLTMRVVVGRVLRRTPVFSDHIRYLVLNPSWEVPLNLAVQDKLPKIREDPGYLERQGFTVYRGWGAEQQVVDPARVDWSALGRGNFPYRLRQGPGPKNALGRIKFMFPNRWMVYLHDTPERGLFQRAARDLSSGCIRVEKPLELAEHLLQDTPPWDRRAVEAVLASGRETTVSLSTPVPVHLLYWTAAAAEDGTVHFRDDLYHRDPRLDQALAALAGPSGP